MAFVRSRVMVALIGLVIIGGASAAAAVVATSQPFQMALIGASQTNNATSVTGAKAPTATASGSRPTATVAPTATSRPAQPPGGQLIDLHGVVASTNPSAGTFVVRTFSSRVNVVVTNTTTFQGAATNLSGLNPGWQVEVKGSRQADGSFLAVDVNANRDN